MAAVAIGRASRKFRILRTYLKDRKNLHFQAFLYNRNNTRIPAKGLSFSKGGGF